jgi:hypothetical protein
LVDSKHTTRAFCKYITEIYIRDIISSSLKPNREPCVAIPVSGYKPTISEIISCHRLLTTSEFRSFWYLLFLASFTDNQSFYNYGKTYARSSFKVYRFLFKFAWWICITDIQRVWDDPYLLKHRNNLIKVVHWLHIFN